MLNTRNVREILRNYDIESVTLEGQNGKIAEGFEYMTPSGSYQFVLTHKGTAISMINAFKMHLSGKAFDSGNEDVKHHMSDASDALVAAITGKPSTTGGKTA